MLSMLRLANLWMLQILHPRMAQGHYDDSSICLVLNSYCETTIKVELFNYLIGIYLFLT